jgi:hypothetical protein
MKDRGIQIAGSLLGLTVLGTLIWYGRSPRLLLAGVVYLMAATYVAFVSVTLATSLRTRKRRSIPCSGSFVFSSEPDRDPHPEAYPESYGEKKIQFARVGNVRMVTISR